MIFGGAALPATIDLANLGSAGITIFGADESDFSGSSVSSAGDLNGDGFDDLLVGADGADASGNAKSNAGDSYVIFGGAALPATIDLASLGSAGITIFGAETYDLSGGSVSGAGDVNGDGFDELLIGADRADSSGNAKSAAGDNYVIFGGTALPATIDLANLGSAGITIFGADTNDLSGNSVSSAGDVNGDGFDDLLIGANRADSSGNAKSDAGDSYILFGGDFTASVTHAGTAAGETLTGNNSANVMIGGRGNDTLIGNGGADVLRGGEGNDVLAVSSTAFKRVVGGNGSDTLRLDGSRRSLNLTTLKDNRIVDVEMIDITGAGNNTLTLTQREVLNISGDANTLLVQGNGGDRVLFEGGWTRGADEIISSTTYRVLTKGAATLKVATAVTLVKTTIDLASLTSEEGATIFGAEANDNSGYSVSSAGDVNGDGFDDLLIGADFADASSNGKSGAGDSYVIFGRATFPATIDLANLGSAGITIFGANAGDYSGYSVSSAGDVNGDGFDDLLIGAYRADASGNAKLSAGDSYVIFGGAALPSTINLANLGSAGITIFGAETNDQSGISVNSAGDVNGDGFDDLLIAAPYADASGNAKSDAGDSYVIFGGAALPATINLATLGSAGITIFGADASDNSGISVSSAGDVNGDGFDDLLIGASSAAASGNGKSYAGDSYVIFGGAALPSMIDLGSLGTAGITIFGAEANDRSGSSVSSAGDVNGDGFDDLLIGAYRADASGNARSYAGDSYVIFGGAALPATINLANLGSDGITLFGAEANDRSGISVSSAGDVNGDGFDDLLIGAHLADASGNAKSAAGESYILFGGDFTTSVTHAGTAANETLTGNASANVMIGGRGNDTLIGNGGADVLRGGKGNDVLAVSSTTFNRVVGGSGSDTLRLDGTGLSLNLTTLKDNRVVDVEAIDIRGSGNNTLMLTQREVLNISGDSNRLLVRRNTGDVVNIGLGWTQGANQTISGVVYHIFTQGAATLGVEVTHTGSLFQLSGGTLTVAGSSVADTVTISAATNTSVALNGITLDFTPVLVASIIVNGNDGADTITASSLLNGTSFTANGGSSNDVLTVAAGVTRATSLNGGADDDTLTGGGGNDTLAGDAGSDILRGGAGSDSLIGGFGNDIYVFGTATSSEADVVTENSNSGSDTLNFSGLTTAVSFNLGFAAAQPVHTNRTLQLSSTVVIENIIGGSGNDALTGNLLPNVLTGNGGNDRLNGASGNDSLFGGLGDDSYIFSTATSAEADVATENPGEGTEVLSFLGLTTSVAVNLGSSAVQTVHTNRTLQLSSAGEFENAIGGSGADTLTGNSLANVLNGSAGDDTLNDSPGNDSLIGGLGDDSYLFSGAATAEADSVTEGTGQGTDTVNFASLTTAVSLRLGTSTIQAVHSNRTLKLNSTAVFENVISGSGGDTLTGNSLANVLTGNAGNDILTGAAGNDSLIGGLGDDSYIFSTAGSAEADSVTESAGEGTDSLSFLGLTTSVSLNLSSSLMQTVHTHRALQLSSGSAFENVLGGSSGDTLTGNSLANVLTGNAGNDTLTGGAGNDSLIGGLGDDGYLFGNAGGAEVDTVTEASDQGTDTLNFSAMTTAVTLNLGTSLIQTVHANRTVMLNSSATFENVTGGSADDILFGNSANNVLNGGGGRDIVVGNSGNDTLNGEAGRDVLIGGLGLDTINGGSDYDILIAGRTTNDTNVAGLIAIRTE